MTGNDFYLCAGTRPFTAEEVTEVLKKEEVNGYGIMAPSGPQVST